MRLKETFKDITDEQIRRLFNGARDGTANDALVRHLCQIALYERVVFDKMHPSKHRYPKCDEYNEARRRLAEIWARRRS